MDPEKQKADDEYEAREIEKQAIRDRVKARDEEREKEREKNRPKPLTPTEIQKKEIEKFEEGVKELKEEPLKAYTEQEIINNFLGNRDDRRVLFDLAVNMPTMNSKIRDRLDLAASDESKVRYILKKFRIMGIAKENMVLPVWIKDYCNKNFKKNLKKKLLISAEERIILKKMSWAETMNERERNRNIAVSGFWSLTELGKRLLPLIKSVCSSQATT